MFWPKKINFETVRSKLVFFARNYPFVTESKNILFQTSKKLNFQISKYQDIESLRIVTNIQITNPYKYPDIEIYSTQKFLCTDAAFFVFPNLPNLNLQKLPNRVQDFQECKSQRAYLLLHSYLFCVCGFISDVAIFVAPFVFTFIFVLYLWFYI